VSFGGRLARCLARTVFNIAGVAFVLALTASSFDATELAALAFLSVWFVVVEAAALLSKIEIRGTGVLLAYFVVLGMTLGTCPVRPGSVSMGAVVAAPSSMPLFEAAVARLRSTHG
jgi:hypothetical protein